MHSNRVLNHRLIFVILYLTYICAGIISILPGPTLPLLAANTGVPLEIAGWIFTTSATGFMVGVVIAGLVSQRFGPKYVLMSGLVIMAGSGIATPLAHTFSLLLIAQFIQGIGFGFLDVTISMIVGLVFADALSETLNNLHSAYGLGALTAPLILSLALQVTHNAMVAYFSGAIVAVAGISLLLRQHIPSAPAAHEQHKVEQQNSTIASNSLFRQPLLWLLALQIALYVGAEVGFGNWIVTAVSLSAAIPLVLAAPCATLLWSGLTAGRLMGAQILKRGIVSENILLYISVIGSSLSGLLVAVFAGNIVISFSASALVGFFFGPIFPGIMAIASRYFAKTLGTVSGILLVSASVTAMILPLTMGLLIPTIGIHWVMAFPALACLAVSIPLSFALRQQRYTLQSRADVHTMKQDIPLSGTK
jgi:fucose permease